MKWLIRGLTGVVVLGLLGLVLLPPDEAASQPSQVRYLSLEVGAPGAPGTLGSAQNAIPPDCSTWHELYPAFCGTSHQDGYNDNGDGVVSMCDEIILDGATWHITWVGPTYYVTCTDPATGSTREAIVEPNLDPHDPGNPVCETWQEIWPNFGDLCHVDDWADADGSGNLTVCDFYFSKGFEYHIDDIRLNIIIEPGPLPIEDSTWGKIKQRFSSLFD